MSYEVFVDYEDDDYVWTGVLRVIVDGELVSQYSDGGEPEDQTFGRDWSWVSSELKKAYELGKKHGVREILDNMTRGKG